MHYLAHDLLLLLLVPFKIRIPTVDALVARDRLVVARVFGGVEGRIVRDRSAARLLVERGRVGVGMLGDLDGGSILGRRRLGDIGNHAEGRSG